MPRRSHHRRSLLVLRTGLLLLTLLSTCIGMSPPPSSPPSHLSPLNSHLSPLTHFPLKPHLFSLLLVSHHLYNYCIQDSADRGANQLQSEWKYHVLLISKLPFCSALSVLSSPSLLPSRSLPLFYFDLVYKCPVSRLPQASSQSIRSLGPLWRRLKVGILVSFLYIF